MYVKCANTFPKKVTDIILSCVFKDEERNPAVYTDFLICVSTLPIDCVEKIGQKVLNERWYDFIEYYWFAKEYVELIERLYINERYSIAIELARHAFAPKLQTNHVPAPYDELINHEDVITPFDSYWFEDTLRDKIPKLVQKNSVSIIELISMILDEYIKLDNQIKGINSKHDDGSYIWYRAIEEPDQNRPSGIKSILVFHLRNCLLYIGNHDVQKLKDIMSIIHQKDYWVYRRLELYVYEQFSHAFEREIIISILWYFGITDTHHEYYQLIRRVFATLPTHVKQRIFELIDGGFEPEIFERIRNKDGEIAAKSREKYWKLQHFEPIKDELDEEHSKAYTKLVEEFGVPEHPSYLYYITARIGSPAIEPDLFRDKTVDQVFEIVKNHVIPKGSFAFDDITVATFEKYVEGNSLDCSKKSSKHKISDASIQYALFSGLGHAVRNGKDMEWGGVLPLIENVVSSATHGKNHVSQSYDPILAIYSLMEDGFKKDSISFQLRDKVWRVIKQLIEIGTRAQEPKGYSDSQTDSLSISMNNINGMSFHVVYQYATWCERRGNLRRVLVPEVKQVFDDYLDKKLGCHTVSRNAVFGVFFPNFYYLDQQWVKNILKKIRSGKNEWIAFWDGYVSWNNLSGYVFDDLYTWYDKFLNEENLIRNRKLKHPYNSTIDHAMLGVFVRLG